MASPGVGGKVTIYLCVPSVCAHLLKKFRQFALVPQQQCALLPQFPGGHLACSVCLARESGHLSPYSYSVGGTHDTRQATHWPIQFLPAHKQSLTSQDRF